MIEYGPGKAIRDRVLDGEMLDIVILPRPLVEGLAKQGKIMPESMLNLARSDVGMGIRAGAPSPDIKSLEAFKGWLLAAKSIVCSDPAIGATTSVYFTRMLERLGIADQMTPKIRFVSDPHTADYVAKSGMHYMPEADMDRQAKPPGSVENDPNRSLAEPKCRFAASPDLKPANPLCCHPGQGQRMRFDQVKRRSFITLVGGAAMWPMAARGQQQAMPVIGFLNPASPEGMGDRLRGFRRGLKESGYVESENVAVEYRWGESQFERMRALATDLVRRRVAVLVATGALAASVAREMTTTIPIVFLAAEDPVRLGLVASLARPGGNRTGINLLSGELVAKRLELLREILPTAKRVAVLVNPTNPTNLETTLRDAEPAARHGAADARPQCEHWRRNQCSLRYLSSGAA